MAEHTQDAPMAKIDTTDAQDEWIFRAIDKQQNVMYVVGRDTLINARRRAHELLREGYLVEDPIRKEARTWRV